MKQSERITFNETREIFNHSIAYLSHIRDLLDRLKDSGDLSQRVRMLLESYAVDHRNLLGAMEQYAKNADQRLLNTYAQYTVELPAEPAGPGSSLTSMELTRWLQTLYSHLRDLYQELAESTPGEEIRTALQGLVDQIESHQKKLSKEYQRFEDL